MHLAEKLKNARISHKISQKTLSEKLGVSRATLSLWESGKSVPSPLYLREYQRLFDFEKGYFDSENKKLSSPDTVSFDVSALNPLGRHELEKFYGFLIKRKEYLKKH